MLARQRVKAVITLTSARQRRQCRVNAGSALLALDRHRHSHTVKALRCFYHSRVLIVLRQCRPNADDAGPALTHL